MFFYIHEFLVLYAEVAVEGGKWLLEVSPAVTSRNLPFVCSLQLSQLHVYGMSGFILQANLYLTGFHRRITLESLVPSSFSPYGIYVEQITSWDRFFFFK
jgi:hypothetical protein